MIERYATPRLRQNSNRHGPHVITESEASLACGCVGYVGRVVGSGKEVAILQTCSRVHDEHMQRVQERLVEAFQQPGSGELVELVERLLRETP